MVREGRSAAERQAARDARQGAAGMPAPVTSTSDASPVSDAAARRQRRMEVAAAVANA